MIHQLLLIRHGQTDDNAAGIIQGHNPTSLNATGRREARRLAESLADQGVCARRLVSSDLARALQTADSLAEQFDLPIEVNIAWRERYFGSLQGRPLSAGDIWLAAGGQSEPPGAEPSEQMAVRVRRALLEVAQNAADCTLVVTHGGPLRMILRLMQSGLIPLAEGQTPPPVQPIRNCGMLRLNYERGDGRFVVVSVDVAERGGE